MVEWDASYCESVLRSSSRNGQPWRFWKARNSSDKCMTLMLHPALRLLRPTATPSFHITLARSVLPNAERSWRLWRVVWDVNPWMPPHLVASDWLDRCRRYSGRIDRICFEPKMQREYLILWCLG